MTPDLPSLATAPHAPVETAARDQSSSPDSAGLDLDLLTFLAVLGICHSEERISVGLTVTIPGRAPETLAATDDLPVRADWLQHEYGQGPAVSPERSQLVVCKDLAADQRWPDFGRMCAAVLGLRSMVNVAVPLPGIRASLNLYSAEPTAFDRFDVDAALRLAQLAAPAARRAVGAISDVHAELPRSDASQVVIALATVMAQRRVGPTDGFAVLREAARHSSRPLFDVAVELVRNGGLPDQAIAAPVPLRPGREPAPSNLATEHVPLTGGPTGDAPGMPGPGGRQSESPSRSWTNTRKLFSSASPAHSCLGLRGTGGPQEAHSDPTGGRA